MIRFELLKLRRSRRPWIAFCALVLFLVLMLVGFYVYAQNRTRGQADFRYTFENSSYFNGLTFSAYAFYFGSVLLLPLFMATEGGTQIAGETSTGSLLLLLTRPLGKSRLFLTKFGVSAGYGLLLVGAYLAATLLVGLFLIGWGELKLYPGVLQMTPTPQRLGQAQALGRFALIWPAACVALLVPLSFSFLLSSYARSAVNAATTAIALFLVLHVISGVPFFGDLRPFLFTSHMGYWRGLLQEQIDWRAVSQDAAKLLANAFFFLAIAHRRFCSREEV